MGGTPTARLTVPRGSVVVLIGPAGSGKSTLAARLFPSVAVLSSDTLRARIGKGEADQTVTGAAFAALHRALETRLTARQTTIIDATSLAPAARSALLKRARAHDATAVAIVLDLPPDIVLARNAGRAGRVVPEPAVRRQLAMLRAVTDPVLAAEGFAIVQRLRSDADLAALRIEDLVT
ncbi:MAG: AAA family ATPase [Chloroflexota bacterium]